MADGEVLALRQEMSLSRGEFLRSLPAAVGGVAFELAATGARHHEGAKRWRIVLAPLPDLALGSVRLPRQRVEIHLAGYDAAATREFLDRFELYYRRAGG